MAEDQADIDWGRSLFGSMPGDEGYAIERRPSFEPRTKICVARTGEVVSLTAVSGWDKQPVTRQLSVIQWNDLMTVLADADFWNMPRHEPEEVRWVVHDGQPRKVRTAVADGTRVDVEGFVDGRRHLVSRHRDERDLDRIGRAFHVLAGYR